MDQETTESALEMERLRLERERLELERERLAAAHARAEKEERLSKPHRSVSLVVPVVLLAALSFAGGMIAGSSIAEARQQRQREARLNQALSKIGAMTDVSVVESFSTNSVPALPLKTSSAHQNVSVMVIQ